MSYNEFIVNQTPIIYITGDFLGMIGKVAVELQSSEFECPRYYTVGTSEAVTIML